MEREIQIKTEPKIFSAISSIMGEIGFISKDRKNSGQGYMFRGVDDVYLACQRLLAQYGVVCSPKVLSERSEERTTPKGTVMIYRILTIEFTFFASDGSSFSTVMIGEGMDSGDKASNKAMAVAHKYALLQVFCIPTEEAKDPENDSHEIKPKSQQTQAAQRQEPVSEKKVESPQGVAAAVLKVFGEWSIDRAMLEAFLQNTRLESMTQEQRNMLRQVANGLKTGELTVVQVFGKSSRPVDELNAAFS